MGRGPRHSLGSNLSPRALPRMLLRATVGSIRYVVEPAQLVVGTACGQMAILHPEGTLLSVSCEFVIGIETQLANLALRSHLASAISGLPCTTAAEVSSENKRVSQSPQQSDPRPGQSERSDRMRLRPRVSGS